MLRNAWKLKDNGNISTYRFWIIYHQVLFYSSQLLTNFFAFNAHQSTTRLNF